MKPTKLRQVTIYTSTYLDDTGETRVDETYGILLDERYLIELDAGGIGPGHTLVIMDARNARLDGDAVYLSLDDVIYEIEEDTDITPEMLLGMSALDFMFEKLERKKTEDERQAETMRRIQALKAAR